MQSTVGRTEVRIQRNADTLPNLGEAHAFKTEGMKMSAELAVYQAAPSLAAGSRAGALIPRNIEELQLVAKLMFSSGLMPTSIKSAEAVAVAVMAGLEVGLSPMSAVQNIAVINGRPAIWGDAMLAIVQASGLLDDFSEEPMLDAAGNTVGFRCRAIRRGQATPIEDAFTLDDARKANLIGKAGPWKEYPARMLRLRARAFVLRNGFADVLRGLASREEVEDYPQVTARALPAARPAVSSRTADVAANLTEDALPTPPAPPTPIAPAPAPKQAASSAPAGASNELRGVLEKVSVKNGTGKKGPWTKYGLLIGGNWYGTFEGHLGEDAAVLEGTTIVITWKPDGDYRTVTSITSADMVDDAAKYAAEEAAANNADGGGLE